MSSFYDDASLVVIPSGYKTSKIYAEKPTDGSGDLTFTRASDATRVGANGLIEEVRTNLVLQSNTFSTTWANSDSTETSGQAGYDGTNNAWLLTTTLSGGFIFQSVAIGGLTTFSIYAKAGTQNGIILYSVHVAQGINFNLSTGVVGAAFVAAPLGSRIESIGNGWYRCSITVSSSSTNNFRIYVSDGSNPSLGNVLIQNSQVEAGDIATNYITTTTAAVSVGPVNNVPRLDYLGSSCPRLLLEPQRTNLALYSEQFNNAYWLNSGLSLSVNSATSPDGYVNADIATETATTSQHGLSSGVISFTSGTTYTFSAFAKNAPSGRGFIQLYGYQLGSGAANVFANFDLNTGVVGTATGGTSTITNYGNGWYRCTFTFTCGNSLSERINLFNVTSASATAGQSYAGDITKAIYWYGAMVEAGAYATSYIPTLGASVTRVADNAYKTGISSLIGQTEGTLFVEFVVDSSTSPTMAFFVSAAGVYDNAIWIQQSASDSVIFRVFSGSSAQCSITKTGLTNGQTVKVAGAYKANDFVLYVNGVQVGTDNSGSIPSSMSQLEIGSYSEVGAPFNQNRPVKQALLFKTRLTNAEMQELTTL